MEIKGGKMIKNQKGIALIVILVAILVVEVVTVGGMATVYLMNKTSKSDVSTEISTGSAQAVNKATLNWQIYTNDRYGYSVKYPKDWYYRADFCCPPPPTAIMISNVPDNKTLDYAIFDVIVDPAMGRTLDNYEEVTSLVADGYKKTQITVSGEPAVKLERHTHPADNGGTIYVKHNDIIYRLSWGGTSQTVFQTHKNTLEKIVNSFTFTK